MYQLISIYRSKEIRRESSSPLLTLKSALTENRKKRDVIFTYADIKKCFDKFKNMLDREFSIIENSLNQEIQHQEDFA